MNQMDRVKEFFSSRHISDRKVLRLQMLFLTVLAVCLTAANIQSVAGTYVTTMYAFTYNHGFLARGVMGSVLLAADRLLPGTQYSYDGVLFMCYAQDFVFTAALLLFFYGCLRSVQKEIRTVVFLLCVILGIVAFPEFIAFQNFGRTDAVCALLTILMAALILKKCAVWLCVPLCALGVMIHQGFVLQFLGLVLVLLFCRMVDSLQISDESGDACSRETGKYAIVILFSIAVSGVIFLLLNYNHSRGETIYPAILETAEQLANPDYHGEVHRQLLMHEILGLDPAEDEWEIHVLNFRESIIYLLLISPYLVLTWYFFRGLFRKLTHPRLRLKYAAVVLGAWLILPDFLFKIDFGRWFFSLIWYYFIVVLFLAAAHTPEITEILAETGKKLHRYPLLAAFLVGYPLVLTPMGDTWITQLSLRLTNLIWR